MSDLSNRTYVVFNVSEIDKIDFSEVLETSNETLLFSADKSKTFVKFTGETPSCILKLSTIEDTYTHAEMIQLISSEEWKDPNEKYFIR